ncbi:MAG: hypothetical protein V4494_06070 [Chlamydiota bacterium]
MELDIYIEKYKKNKKQLTAPDRVHDWFWVIGGSPREQSGPSLNDSSILEFKHGGAFFCGGYIKREMFALSMVDEKYRDCDADLIISPLGPTLDVLPFSYGGMSGGGLYQVKLKEIRGHKNIEDLMFAGVFVADNGECLVSRGHVSLYEVFCRYLDDFIANHE